MDHGPDVADYQPERVASSHDDLQDRIARISDMDPTLLFHDLFYGDDSSSSNLLRRSVIEQPITDTDTTQSGSVSQARRESDDCTNHEMSSLRLLETRDRDELSQPPSEVEFGQRDSTAPWLPFYLRRTTSLLFLAIFAIMIVILETLFTLSLRNSGLSAGTTSIRYLWSYGTTGTLTLAAAFWHRLDYEEKVAAPWFKADPITSSKTALLVDYIDTWSLLVPFRAFINHDYNVACSSVVSLLLQLVIVLSTALFVLTPVTLVNEAEPILLTSRFVDDPSRLEDSDSMLPGYITMRTQIPTSLVDPNFVRDPQSAYTEGCTNQFAYQTFNPVSSELLEVDALIDGLTMNLRCEPASTEKKVAIPQIRYFLGTDQMTWVQQSSPSFQVHYEGCETAIEWHAFISDHLSDDFYPRNNKTIREHAMILQGVHGFSRNQCNSTEKNSHRLVFLSAEVEWRSIGQPMIDDYGEQTLLVNIDATVLRGVALACTPSLERIPLNVSRNSAGVQRVSPLSGETKDFFNTIHPWDFIEFYLNDDDGPVAKDEIGPETKDEVGPVTVNSIHQDGNLTLLADGYSMAILDFCGQSCQAMQELLDNAFLERILATFISSYAAATAHVLLRETANTTSTGTSTSTVERLWVQPVVCQAMVGVLVIQILLVLAIQSEHKKRLLHRTSPGSIAATMVLAGHVCSEFSKNLGSASMERLVNWIDRSLKSHGAVNLSSNSCSSSKEVIPRTRKGAKLMDWATSSHNTVLSDPVPLRPVSRIALFSTVAGCSITLACLLAKSDDEQGLGEGVGSRYRLYAWTTVPATILTVASWWLSSIDIQVRQLGPYHSLKQKRFGAGILQLNLLRGLTPSVLYWEIKTSNFAAVASTMAALFGATLTTASAALFHVIIYPVSRPVALSPSTVFTTIPVHSIVTGSGSNFTGLGETSTPGLMSSLILEANLSYSHQAYQDLVFPTFSMTPHETEDFSQTMNWSSTTINLTVPALRPRLSCRLFSRDDITANYGTNYTFPAMGIDRPLSGIAVNVTTEICERPYGANAFGTAFLETEGRSESLFAATNSDLATIPMMMFQICSEHLYIWGNFNASPGPITNISALACNSSVELVHATMSLVREDMSLDLSNTPKAIESTAIHIKEYGPVNFGYVGLASLLREGNTLFDPFFQQLVTSRYAIPISAIGDPAQSQVVIDAIHLQHGVIHAQFLSTNYVMDIDYPKIKENMTNVLMPSLFFNETTGERIQLQAEMTYPFGRHRVVQDPTATAILEVLLLSVLILSILGWWSHPTAPALPRSPTSVASVLALLAGGNLLEHIYDGSPEPLCWEDIESRLGKDSKFYLGWDSSTSGKSSSERRFGIWMINERNQECSS